MQHRVPAHGYFFFSFGDWDDIMGEIYLWGGGGYHTELSRGHMGWIYEKRGRH